MKGNLDFEIDKIIYLSIKATRYKFLILLQQPQANMKLVNKIEVRSAYDRRMR